MAHRFQVAPFYAPTSVRDDFVRAVAADERDAVLAAIAFDPAWGQVVATDGGDLKPVAVALAHGHIELARILLPMARYSEMSVSEKQPRNANG